MHTGQMVRSACAPGRQQQAIAVMLPVPSRCGRTSGAFITPVTGSTMRGNGQVAAIAPQSWSGAAFFHRHRPLPPLADAACRAPAAAAAASDGCSLAM